MIIFSSVYIFCKHVHLLQDAWIVINEREKQYKKIAKQTSVREKISIVEK